MLQILGMQSPPDASSSSVTRVDDHLFQGALGGGRLEDVAFHAVRRHQAIHDDGLSLPDAVDAVLGLQVCREVGQGGDAP